MVEATLLKTGEIAPTNNIFKKIVKETNAAATTADTVSVTLSEFGCTKFLGVLGYKHTTEDSVVVVEDPTTAVLAGVLTITIPATGAGKRVYEILMR